MLLLFLGGCGGSGTSTSPSSGAANPTPSAITHVALVVLENNNYGDVVGNSAMPYLNGLIQRSALATNYYANTHPSIGNYFAMTTGQIITNDDAFSGVVSGDNLARDFNSVSKTWRLYAQSLPSAGYLGPDVYPYVRHHAPFTYFSDVRNDPAQQANVVPLTQLSSDISTGVLPGFAMIVPDQQNNGHDCPAALPNCSLSDRLAAADQWLKSNVQPLLAVPGELVVVTFDESADDNTHGGGHVATVVLGAGVKPAFQSTTFYQHQSLYRFILELNHVSSLPPDAESAPAMSEFLQ